MGWGVGDDETFEALLEHRLNRERPNKRVGSYEILNFGVPGYQPLQQLMVLEKSMVFQPNAIIYVAHPREAARAVGICLRLQARTFPYPMAI